MHHAYHDAPLLVCPTLWQSVSVTGWCVAWDVAASLQLIVCLWLLLQQFLILCGSWLLSLIVVYGVCCRLSLHRTGGSCVFFFFAATPPSSTIIWQLFKNSLIVSSIYLAHSRWPNQQQQNQQQQTNECHAFDYIHSTPRNERTQEDSRSSSH